jgi:hypothetical protein
LASLNERLQKEQAMLRKKIKKHVGRPTEEKKNVLLRPKVVAMKPTTKNYKKVRGPYTN